MPEGPSILIAKEAMLPFIGERVIAASGNAKIEMGRINDQIIRDIKIGGSNYSFVLTTSACGFIS